MDLISRQAAIEALEREQSLVERPITETRWFDLGLRKAQEVINGLPSAEPGPVVRCKNCVYSELWKPPLFWCRMFDHHTEEIGYCWKARRKEIENGTTNT